MKGSEVQGGALAPSWHLDLIIFLVNNALNVRVQILQQRN
jgi:hypothetical protein